MLTREPRVRLRISTVKSFLACLFSLALMTPSPPATAARASASDEHEEVRGMTISCQTWGWEWGTDEFALELEELRDIGVNWVAIHPYARIHRDGHLSWRRLGNGESGEPPEHIARPIREAHARGLSILIKPHLAYWGSPFAWRGDIAFEDPASSERFWSDYKRWIAEIAEAGSEADAFAVGTELDRTVGDEGHWREVIAEVRRRTDAQLTYAANWDTYAAVGFWDALDAVGIQAYFPLSNSAAPRRGDLLDGWALALEPLRTLHRSTGKPVVFTELGYNLSTRAAAQPWDHEVAASTEQEAAERLQALCLRTGLEVLQRERAWLRGAFLWKWFVGPTRGENFLVDTPQLRGTLSELWLRAAEGD